MLENGYIKIHRKIWQNAITTKPNYLAVWLYLLSAANIRPVEKIWNGEKIKIDRGQCIVSARGIADHFGLSTGTVAYILNYLKVEQMIEHHATHRFTFVTILNYEDYQDAEHHLENKLKTNEKQSENKMKQNKKDKKEKKDKRDISEQDYTELANYFLLDVETVKRTHDKILDWEKSKKGGAHYKDMKAALRNWLRSSIDDGKVKQGGGIRPWA